MGKKDKERIPSPCIDICKDMRGVCIACGRSKREKKAWKKAGSDEDKFRLIEKCLESTEEIGTQEFWLREYRRKCLKKGAELPLALLDRTGLATADE